jgi:hypothetical protein
MSPILIDTGRGRAQYHLTSAENGVVFDIAANGEPVKIAWTRPDSDVAFLVLDRNGNRQIDNGLELFGSSTRLADGRRASNGFAALSEFDSNADDRIDATDAVFSRLRLWLDRNHNGVSEPRELESLRDNGIVSIGTSYTESSRYDQYGNWFRYVGTMLVDGRRRDREVRIYDVYCATMSVETTR